ncbi:unnamed protein product [Arctogadus glacialis]
MDCGTRSTRNFLSPAVAGLADEAVSALVLRSLPRSAPRWGLPEPSRVPGVPTPQTLLLIDWRFFERMKPTLLMARFENPALKNVP